MDNSYKTYRAYRSGSRLPRFINTNSDSDFLKLINIPNLELDSIYKDIIETAHNVIPSSLNLGLPSVVYQAIVDTGSVISEGTETTLYDLTYGLPTGLKNNVDNVAFPNGEFLDIHFLSPLYYTDENKESQFLEDGYLALTDGANWFDQEIQIFDSTLSQVFSYPLPTFKQDLINATEDEWITLDENDQYTIAKSPFKELKVIDVSSMQPLSFGTFWNFVDDDSIQIFPPYNNHSLVVEYEYAPSEKLYSLTYLENFHNVLTNIELRDSFLYLDSTVYTENIQPVLPSAESSNIALFKDQFVGLGSKISGEAVLSKNQSFADRTMVPWLGTEGEELLDIAPDIIPNYEVPTSYDTETLTLTFDNWTDQTPGEPGSYGFQQDPSVIATWSNLFTTGSTYIWEITITIDEVAEDAGGGPINIKQGDTTIVSANTGGTIGNQYTVLSGDLDLIIDSDSPIKGTLQISMTRTATEVLYYYTDIDLQENYNSIQKVSIGPYTAGNLEVDPGELTPSNSLIYQVIGNELIRIISYSQYSNFTAVINYYKDYTIAEEACIDSGITYELDGRTRSYYTINSLDSVVSTGGYTSFISGTFSTSYFPHKSIAWYPHEKHIEENDFSLIVVSLNHNNFIEFYNKNGTVLNRFPLGYSSDYEYISIRIFSDYVVLLKKDTVNAIYKLCYYNIHTMEISFQLEYADPGETNIVSFSFDNELHPILIGDKLIRLYPEYNYYTRLATAVDELEYIWFREKPSDYEFTIEITEHAVDHWGRVLGSDRWPKESLKNYLHRLTQITTARGDTSHQGALNGISATLGTLPYTIHDKLVYPTSKPIHPVDTVLLSSTTAAGSTMSLFLGGGAGDNYIDCEASELFVFTETSHTYAIWVKATLITTLDEVLISTGSSESGYSEIGVRPSGKLYHTDGVDEVETPESVITADTWHHVAFVYRSSTGFVEFYVDGDLKSDLSKETPIVTTTGNIWFGRSLGNGSSYFGGYIDEVAIWNEDLTAEEISTIYYLGPAPLDLTESSGAYISSENIIGYWKFEEGAGNQTADSSDSGNDGTLLNDFGAIWSTDVPKLYTEIIDLPTVWDWTNTTLLDGATNSFVLEDLTTREKLVVDPSLPIEQWGIDGIENIYTDPPDALQKTRLIIKRPLPEEEDTGYFRVKYYPPVAISNLEEVGADSIVEIQYSWASNSTQNGFIYMSDLPSLAGYELTAPSTYLGEELYVGNDFINWGAGGPEELSTYFTQLDNNDGSVTLTSAGTGVHTSVGSDLSILVGPPGGGIPKTYRVQATLDIGDISGGNILFYLGASGGGWQESDSLSFIGADTTHQIDELLTPDRYVGSTTSWPCGGEFEGLGHFCLPLEISTQAHGDEVVTWTLSNISVREVLTMDNFLSLAYYTKDLVTESPFFGEYLLYNESIDLQRAATPTTNQFDIIQIQDSLVNNSIPSEYLPLVENASDEFNFKWGEFSWDKYIWADGESLKTGIPTVFDALTKRTGSCSEEAYITDASCQETDNVWTYDTAGNSTISGTVGPSLMTIAPPKSTESFEATIPTKSIHLTTGAFYYRDTEYFLYPTQPHFEALADSYTEPQPLYTAPNGFAPTIVKDQTQSLIASDRQSIFNTVAGGCAVPYWGNFLLSEHIPNVARLKLVQVQLVKEGDFFSSAIEQDPSDDWTLEYDEAEVSITVTTNTGTQEVDSPWVVYDAAWSPKALRISFLATLATPVKISQSVVLLEGKNYILSYYWKAEYYSDQHTVSLESGSVLTTQTMPSSNEFQFVEIPFTATATTDSIIIESFVTTNYMFFSAISIKPTVASGYTADMAGSGISLVYTTQATCITHGVCDNGVIGAYNIQAEGMLQLSCNDWIDPATGSSGVWMPYSWLPQNQIAYLVEGDKMKGVYDYNNTTFGFMRPVQRFTDFSNYTGSDSTIDDIINSYSDPSSDYTYSISNVPGGPPVLRSNLDGVSLLAMYNSEDSKICDTGVTLDKTISASNMLLVIGEEYMIPLTVTIFTDRAYYTKSDTEMFIYGQVLDSETAGVNNVEIDIHINNDTKSTLSDITGKYRRNIDISNYESINLTVFVRVAINSTQFDSDTLTITYIEETG